jgi:hypothetical protein
VRTRPLVIVGLDHRYTKHAASFRPHSHRRHGNLTIADTLTETGSIVTQLRNTDGTYSASYATHATIPTVEDMGEARLAGGAAFVPIDAALQKSINASRGYLVFLTPQGATTGLYVASKSAGGFAVREIGNARDSIAFDYRVVAHPVAESGRRLAAATGIIQSAAARKALPAGALDVA